MAGRDRYGIRVVQQGEDIETVPPDEMDYSSEFQSPKVSVPYLGEVVGNNFGAGSTTVAHPYVYAPVAIAFYRAVGERWKAIDNSSIGVETNRLNFVIRLKANTSSFDTNPRFQNKTTKFKVWLLLDPAQEIL